MQAKILNLGRSFFVATAMIAFSSISLANNQEAQHPAQSPSGGQTPVGMVGGTAITIALPQPPSGSSAGRASVLQMPAQVVAQSTSSMFAISINDLPMVNDFVEYGSQLAPAGLGYQNQPPVTRFAISVKILAAVLKNGAMPEYKILKIPPDKSTYWDNPDKPISATAALDNAVADLNALGYDVLKNHPHLVGHPTESIVYIRKMLEFLQKRKHNF